MKLLQLNLKGIYFNEIKSGSKKYEYRLCTPYWEKRLVGRHYDKIIVKYGYPNKEDTSKQLERPWKGYTIKKITHPHFGENEVTVFAILINE